MIFSRRQVLLAAAGVSAGHAGPAAGQSASPAVHIDTPGVGNLYRITPRLYRGAQPTQEGFVFLSKTLGVKTIVSLREWHDDAELAAGTALVLQRVGFNTWNIGDDDGAKIVQALHFLRAAEAQGPVLVHCQHGSDRTGAIIALYRILYQGQEREAAIAEMVNGGFGFNPIWASLPEWGNIPGYIRGVDIIDLKRRIAVP